MIEQRRYVRAPIESPLTFLVKGRPESHEGIARDVSIGGMFIETTTSVPFGTEVVIHVRLPGANDTFKLPGVVRWVRNDGMGVQFGLLGAVETHVITEINRKHSEASR